MMFAPARSPPRLSTLILLTALSILSLNMFLPSLAHMAGDLGTRYGVITFALSGYLAISALLQVILGPLSDRFGRRPVLLAGVAIFAAASVVCALAETAWLFLAARMVQAGIVAGSAIAAAVVQDVSDEAEAASVLGYIGMAMAVAPMLAPVVGGGLDALLGWRANFWVYAILGLLATWLVWSDLGETNHSRSSTFRAQIQAYPELLRSRRFWAYSMCLSFGIGAFFLFIAGAPFVAVEIFELSPWALGVGIGSITGGFFLGSFLSGRFSARMGLMWMILAGRVVAALGMIVALALYALGAFHPLIFFAGAVCVGIGNGLSSPSARAGAMAVRPGLAGSAAGLSGALIVALGAVLTVIPGQVLTHQNGAWVLMVLMLGLGVAGLLAALYIRHLERAQAGVS